MELNTLVIVLLLSQVGYPGGQYPGQYPPGQYPGTGGGGIPMPGRKKTSSSSKKDPSITSVFFRGIVRALEDKSIEIESEDSRFVTVQTNDKTKKPKALAIGDSVEITAQDDGKGGFIADSVAKLDKPVQIVGGGSKAGSTMEVNKTDSTEPPAKPAAEQPTTDKSEPAAPEEHSATILQGPKYDQGDEGPPKLKRGTPAARKKPLAAEEADTPPGKSAAASRIPVETARTEATPPMPSSASAPTNPRQAFIEKAREQAEGFLVGLPNYVCQEYTTRYVSEGKAGWHAMDVVSLDLVYIDGKEDYRNIAINGKPWKKPVEESGAWSTGEFGTVLRDIFSPATAAQFKYVKDSQASGLPAHMYDFVVDRGHSHWKVQIVSQSIYPSYKGSIWLDKGEAKPLRIEMQATNIPADFPEDSVESAVDYGFVSLGTQKFFVPLKAEILSCHRGTNVCDRNVIEFRNYHKYSGESNITFK